MSRDSAAEHARSRERRRQEENARTRLMQDVFSLRLGGPPTPAASPRQLAAPSSQQIERASLTGSSQLRIPGIRQAGSSHRASRSPNALGPGAACRSSSSQGGGLSSSYDNSTSTSQSTRSDASSSQGGRFSFSQHNSKSTSQSIRSDVSSSQGGSLSFSPDNSTSASRSTRSDASSSSSHVPGCGCRRCDQANHSTVNLGITQFEIQWRDECVPGCRCDFCLEPERKERYARLEAACPNDGHMLSDDELCGSPNCVCFKGCDNNRCSRCYPDMVKATHHVLRHIASKPRTSPSPPRDRGSGSGRRPAGSESGAAGSSQSRLTANFLRPHITKNELRRRSPKHNDGR